MEGKVADGEVKAEDAMNTAIALITSVASSRILIYEETRKFSKVSFDQDLSHDRTKGSLILVAQQCEMCQQDYLLYLRTPFGCIKLSRGCQSCHEMTSKPTTKSPLEKALEPPGTDSLAGFCTLQEMDGKKPSDDLRETVTNSYLIQEVRNPITGEVAYSSK